MDGVKFLSLDRLNVWYSPGKSVLDDFSLELGDHEIVGLIGLNGAGKTTFGGAIYCLCCAGNSALQGGSS